MQAFAPQLVPDLVLEGLVAIAMADRAGGGTGAGSYARNRSSR
jgi:hypothetical protein